MKRKKRRNKDAQSSRYRQAIQNIYGFTYNQKTKRIDPPDRELPPSVIERINYFSKYAEDGLTFYGCLSCILAYDEEKEMQQFRLGSSAEWLPLTEEFIKWRDETSLSQLEIVAAMIY